jgi:protein O-GlcNAc transferase
MREERAAQCLSLAETHLAREDLNGALAPLAEAHGLTPADPRICFMYAQTLARVGHMADAVRVVEAALTAQPDNASLIRLLVELYQGAGDLKRALKSSERLEKLLPNDPLLRIKTARLWMLVANNTAAVAAFEAALAIDPTCRPALDGLADVWRLDGEVGRARAILLRRAELPDGAQVQAAARLKAAMTLPVVAKDVAEMDAYRARYAAALAAGPECQFTDPWALGLGPNFYLGYQARNDRALQEAQAAYYLAATPSLAFTAPHVGRKPGARIKVGIVSNFFSKHTVGYLSLGLVTHLDRTRFDLVLFRTPNAGKDGTTAKFAAAAPIVDLPPDLNAARQVIADAGLDVLHYPEIGMDHFAYFLAFARLATVQSMAWGHPITSGLSTIDLFLSVDAMEPPGAEAHYREKMVRLQGLSFAGERPAAPEIKDTFLDAKRPAYVCAQSMFKVHPDFDATLAQILRQDTDGLMYFLGHSPATMEILKARLAKSCGPDVERVRFLPRMTGAQFLAMVKAADVLLDIPQWSGGKTSLDAFAMGTPIVHMPGEFMRGRHTLAFYTRMGIESLIADSAPDYAARAVRAVHDGGYRTSIRAEIAGRSAGLFGDQSAVKEYEEVWPAVLHGREGV